MHSSCPNVRVMSSLIIHKHLKVIKYIHDNYQLLPDESLHRFNYNNIRYMCATTRVLKINSNMGYCIFFNTFATIFGSVLDSGVVELPITQSYNIHNLSYIYL